MTNSLNSDVFVPTDTGHFVSDKHMRVAEMIREYDRNLDVRWIPADKRNPNDPSEKPFAVVCREPTGQEYVVFYADELDERLLARLLEADAKLHGNILDKIDANNLAVKALQEREWADQMADRADFMSTVIKSPLHTFKHGGKKYS